MMKILALLALCTLMVTLSASPVSALSSPETLVYEASWGGVTVGTAVQEVTALGDELRIVNTIRSSGLLSAMFPIGDKTVSIISRGGNRPGMPRFFSEKLNEGSFHTQKEARFDFSSLTVDSKDLLKKTEKTDSISASTYDSLSSIYYIRSIELVTGQSIFFDFYDFKHLWNTEVRVVRREEIRTPVGEFKTIMVQSQLRFRGAPSRVGNATFWLSDDDRRIPVRITTELKAGKITLTLVGGSYWPGSKR
jgi:hypothetical protein